MIKNYLFRNRPRWGILALIFLLGTSLRGQMGPDSRVEELGTGTWFNFYSKFRLTDDLFWIAQFHFRRVETERTPWIGQMSKIYNRHALNYMFSPRFNVSLGGVLRVEYNDRSLGENPGFERTVLEPRIWHQYHFAMPFERFMVYHRLRIEHRWKRGFRKGDSYDLRHRWRYMISAKIPVNKPSLEPGAIYLNPDVELIMQNGQGVGGSPLEDLRLIPLVGYIHNPRVSFALGPMYTTGQRIDDPFAYKRRWILRFHTYISLDFRSIEKRLPDVRRVD